MILYIRQRGGREDEKVGGVFCGLDSCQTVSVPPCQVTPVTSSLVCQAACPDHCGPSPGTRPESYRQKFLP